MIKKIMMRRCNEKKYHMATKLISEFQVRRKYIQYVGITCCKKAV